MAVSRQQVQADSGAAAFSRHRGPVTCVAGVPGSRLAVSSGYDSAVGLIDLEAQTIELLGYHRHLVNRVTVNPAGTLAATCSSDYTACLWDIARRAPVRVLRGHWDDVEDFAFVGDHVGVTVSRDRRVLVWDLDSGAVMKILEGHHRDVLSVVHADGLLYTSGDDMTLRQWDLASGALLHVWGPFDVETDTCAIDPLNGRVVLGGDDGAIRIFSIDGGQALHTIEAHRSGIKKVAVSPLNGDILSAAYDQRIRIWDHASFEPRLELQSHAATWERSLNWASDGREVLAGTFDGTVLAWNATSGALQCEIGVDPAQPGNACLNDVSCNRRGVAVTVSDDGLVRTAQLSADGPRWLHQGSPDDGRVLMNAVTVSPDPQSEHSTLVWCGAHDHRLYLCRSGEGRLETMQTLALGEGPINCIRVVSEAGGANGAVQIAYAACYSGAVVRLALANNHQLAVDSKLRLHDGAVKAVRIRAQRDLGASGAADGSLCTWSLDGNIRHQLAGHTAIVDDVDFDPSGSLLASVSRDFTVNVYKVESGRLRHSILLGRESPKCVLFWDSETVFVGNYWGHVWRVTLKDERVSAHRFADNGISSLSRSPQGLLAASYDGSLTLIDPVSMAVMSQIHCLQQKLPGFERAASFDTV